MIVYLIVAFIIGGCLGYLNIVTETKWMKKRKDEAFCIRYPQFRIILFAATATLLAYIFTDFIQLSYLLLMFFICYLIAMLDWKSLIIPNKLLLVMLIVGAVFILFGKQVTAPTHALLGFGIGLLLLFIPYFMGIPIGGGDVKLLAVVGFCTGYEGVLFIMIAVGALMFLYTLVKAFYKKTHYTYYLKDMVPMGPFITGVFFVFTVYQNVLIP